jgi:hypothetical protein
VAITNNADTHVFDVDYRFVIVSSAITSETITFALLSASEFGFTIGGVPYSLTMIGFSMERSGSCRR